MSYYDDVRASTTARPAARTGNGLAWTLAIGGILLMPFTSGLSFAFTLAGGFMMRSPDPAQPDESINDMTLTATAATGVYGCTGCVFSWLTILTTIVGFAIFAVLVAAAAGGGQ